MLLQLAVRADGFLGRLLGLPRGVLEGLDAAVDLFELFGALVESGEPFGDLVEPGRHTRGLLRDLLERLPDRQQLRTARGQRIEHRADGAPLLAGCRDTR